jgi:hypothetical protein
MTIKQLSVFLENRTGGINDVARILGANGINMSAFCIAESGDFGIMRLIVSDTELARKVLRENHFAVNVTDVIALNCPNTAGSLSKILEVLAAADVFIEYMYAFSRGDTASVVIRPTDINKCLQVLQNGGIDLITV